MWQIVSGVFMGWSLGSNDASHVFGTAVASRMVKYTTAIALCAVFVVLGAVLEGRAGIETYQRLSPLSANAAFVVSLSAGATLTLMTWLGLPVSSSQAIVGALVLMGILRRNLDVGSLIKLVVCWVATPVGAALATVVVYFVVGKLMNRMHLTLFQYDRRLRFGLIAAGSYGAYALGANNVANVTGPFVGPGMLSATQAVVIGSLAVALGVLTYSRNVMTTVGKNLVPLDAYTALVAILAEAVTVHVFAIIGVPVSTGQAIVGAVIGIGILKGVRTINLKVLWRVLFAWVGTPALSAAVTLLLYGVLNAMGLG